VWLEANATGQVVEIQGNATGSTIAIEYYAHDSLPMGTVAATVTLHNHTTMAYDPVILDAKCTDCIKDQGFYKPKVLASGVPYGEGQVFTVRLEVVSRAGPQNGTKFNIASLMAYGKTTARNSE